MCRPVKSNATRCVGRYNMKPLFERKAYRSLHNLSLFMLAHVEKRGLAPFLSAPAGRDSRDSLLKNDAVARNLPRINAVAQNLLRIKAVAPRPRIPTDFAPQLAIPADAPRALPQLAIPADAPHAPPRRALRTDAGYQPNVRTVTEEG